MKRASLFIVIAVLMAVAVQPLRRTTADMYVDSYRQAVRQWMEGLYREEIEPAVRTPEAGAAERQKSLFGGEAVWEEYMPFYVHAVWA